MKLKELLTVIDDKQTVTIVVAKKDTPETFALLEEIPVEILLKKAERYISKEVFEMRVVHVWTDSELESRYHTFANMIIKVLDE